MTDFKESLKKLHFLNNKNDQKTETSLLITQPEVEQLSQFLTEEKNNMYSEFGNSALEIHNNIVKLYQELGWTAETNFSSILPDM